MEFLLRDGSTAPKGGRFKVTHGGRGSAKSMSIGQALLVRGLDRPRKQLCGREIQNSIKDSVYALLKECSFNLGMNDFWDFKADGIHGNNGSEFIFKGLRHNAAEIKSMQGLDGLWCEEADKISAASWKYVIPTVRKEYPDGTCSDIIISFNPELEEDYTYQHFVMDPPSSAIVREVNWSENPWFPAVLEAERLELYQKALHSKRLMEEYMWIWEGQCKAAVSGAIYAEELALAAIQGRIRDVPHQKGVMVDTYWDLGRSDETGIWFIQRFPTELHAINYYENTGHHISHYLEMLQQLTEEHGYVYGTHYLPHDADHQLLGQKKSIIDQVRDGGKRRAILVPRPPKKALGINAGRTVFSRVFFDKDNTDVGLGHMRRYRYGVIQRQTDSGGTSTSRTPEPVHDEHSNCADAWQTLGLADRPILAEGKMPLLKPPPSNYHTTQGWMRR